MVKDIEILVVEDEKLNAELLTQLLEALKYKVHWVDNGKAALNKAKNEKPDLILLDIILPGISGYEVCKKINNHPITKDIPIIFISIAFIQKMRLHISPMLQMVSMKYLRLNLKK